MKIALTSLYGVGYVTARKVLVRTNIDENKKSQDLTEEEVQLIRQELTNYMVEGDLRKEVGLNIKRLRDIGSYRGLRHKRGLPVRGQRTHTNARTRKGKAVAIAGKKSVKQL